MPDERHVAYTRVDESPVAELERFEPDVGIVAGTYSAGLWGYVNRVVNYDRTLLDQDLERIADLYCGVGTFTFRLAEVAPVYAADGAAEAADQDGDEEQHRQVEGEGIGRDVGLQRREQAARDAGCNEYMVKPVSKAKLLETISKLMHFSR